MIDLKPFATFRLPTWKNKDAEKYWKWCASNRISGYEWHHLLKRQYGHLLIVNIPAHIHKRIHNKGYEDGEFEDLFIQAIDNLLNYIKHLHTKEK